ncbi:MAG: hypothetical protein LUG46_06365 [Erysipelotrichaceae bacterium]|nr:hypothetical protein [Erysipelotrichaceae bacterium]
MGLFGNNENQVQYDTIEELLMNEPLDTLKEFARNLFKLKIVHKGAKNVIYNLRLKDYFELQVEDGWFFSGLKQKVPKNLKKQGKANGITALKVLEQRGDDPNAACILAVMYELGICEFTPKNLDEANKHYAIAQEQGSRLAPLILSLHDKLIGPDGCFVNEEEVLAYNMLPFVVKDHTYFEIKRLYEELTEEDINDLRLIATIALGYFQSLEYPFSTALIGSEIVSRKQHKWTWKEENSISKSIFDVWPEEEEGQALCGKIYQMSYKKKGNPHAGYVVNAFGFEFQYK